MSEDLSNLERRISDCETKNAEQDRRIKALEDNKGGGQAPSQKPAGWVYPGEGVDPDDSQVPWNAQAGEAGRLVFQGKARFIIDPPPAWEGTREFSLSQTPPPYETAKAVFSGPGIDDSNPSVNNRTPRLIGGMRYYVDITTTDSQAAIDAGLGLPGMGSGHFQLVGGAVPN